MGGAKRGLLLLSYLFIISHRLCRPISFYCVRGHQQYYFDQPNAQCRRSQWPCGLRRRSASAEIVGSNTTGSMDVCLL